jgi:3-phosphoshikimate 1-carboxyvinyltransferase
VTAAGPAALTVVPSGALHGSVRAPGSKSLTNRALLAAALAHGTSRIHSPLVSDDASAMLSAVRVLGARVAFSDDVVVISGTGGAVATPSEPVHCRLSGTTMRFALAVAALASGEVTLTGDVPLLRRPIGPLCQALRDLGARVSDADGFPPATAGGGLAGGTARIDVSGSSQYASAVLLAAPYAAADVTVIADGEAADAYIAMTVDLMHRWGATVDTSGPRRWRVRAGRGYQARDEHVEYDASAAAHLYGLAMATGGSVTVTNVAPTTLQPDAGILEVLTWMGGTVTQDGAHVRVEGPGRLRPVDVDLADMPDQVTTVAALAALADGASHITGVGVTRGHETDRLAALAIELRKVGAAVEEEPDGLRISGPASTAGPVLDTYDDHRLAMAFAAVAARVGATIRDPGCVAKTYPRFWDDAAGLGMTLEA